MLATKLQHKNIILASGSPRRQQFLTELDVPFSIQIKEVKEDYPKELEGKEIAVFLSELKAKAFTELQKNDILITSDTIVWHNNKALGKPKDYNDAFAMLQSLSSTAHQVITAVSFTTLQQTDTITETTKVFFKPLSNEVITYYLDKYKPYDKAGSYGIQEWIGHIGIEKIEGSYANVVGMPIDKVYDKLTEYSKYE